MTGKWLRRTVLLAACASAALLSACGASSIESALRPSRFVVFGDAMSDAGQSGTRYTVNDGTTSLWVEQLASRYGLTLKSSAAGGSNYARAHARVVAKPDATGSSATPTVQQQIDQFLAADKLGANDVVVLNAGVSDVIVQMSTYTTPTALYAAMTQAGKDYATQVRRLVDAGAQHVLVAGAYDLSRSPWGKADTHLDSATGVTVLKQASLAFNEALLVAINDLGAKVLYVDAAYYYNLVTFSPTGYGLTNSTDIACTSVDSGVGIGIGAGEVSSGLCTTSTLASGIDYSKYVFADKVYFTPAAHVLFGNYTYDRLRLRW